MIWRAPRNKEPIQWRGAGAGRGDRKGQRTQEGMEGGEILVSLCPQGQE